MSTFVVTGRCNLDLTEFDLGWNRDRHISRDHIVTWLRALGFAVDEGIGSHVILITRDLTSQSTKANTARRARVPMVEYQPFFRLLQTAILNVIGQNYASSFRDALSELVRGVPVGENTRDIGRALSNTQSYMDLRANVCTDLRRAIGTAALGRSDGTVNYPISRAIENLGRTTLAQERAALRGAEQNALGLPRATPVRRANFGEVDGNGYEEEVLPSGEVMRWPRGTPRPTPLARSLKPAPEPETRDVLQVRRRPILD